MTDRTTTETTKRTATVVYEQTLCRTTVVQVTDEELAILKAGYQANPERWAEIHQRVVDQAVVQCDNEPTEFVSAVCFEIDPQGDAGDELFDVG